MNTLHDQIDNLRSVQAETLKFFASSRGTTFSSASAERADERKTARFTKREDQARLAIADCPSSNLVDVCAKMAVLIDLQEQCGSWCGADGKALAASIKADMKALVPSFAHRRAA